MSDNETQQNRWSPPSSPGFLKARGSPTGGGSAIKSSCRFLCVIFWAAIALLLVNVYLLIALGAEHSSFLGWEVKNAAHLRETVATRFVDEAPKKLAVVVPTHAGDLPDTLKSLEKWPTACSPDTLQHVDLVIYKAEDFDEATENEVLPRFRETAGRCFADTRMVYANLTKEENVYPTGASEQFYDMYLDEGVRAAFAKYDVLGVIEHDVKIAHEDSFSRLYESAFHGSQGYWVKGSVLAGKNFHETATISGFWNVLGHINGNALYNNTDPAFADYVEYTKMRWGYTTVETPGEPPLLKYRFPYDVALWATIADFPYSWPLWQRFAERFVNSHLIANVGFVDVDHKTVSDAVSRDTLFIHGSSTAGGSQKFADAVPASFAQARAGLGERLSKGSVLSDGKHALCTAACGSTGSSLMIVKPEEQEQGTSRVCDPSCLPGGEQGVRFGGYLCGGGNSTLYGESCRTCYTDVHEAREVERRLRLGETVGMSDIESEDMFDDAKEERGRHVIMCDTLRPPSSPDCNKKCLVKTDTVCDHTCGTGRFDNYNCNWRGHGATCRYCFNDVQQALKADLIARQFGGRVIMCDTHEPPQRPDLTQLTSGSAGEDSEEIEDEEERAANLMKMAKAVGESEEEEIEETKIITPFVQELVRADMCAFVPGFFKYINETEATVLSVLTFMPGMKVVVPAHERDFYVYQKTLDDLPRVSVVQVSDVGASALLADKHCGDDAKLIYYLNSGELLSREINFKDTHSPRGDLLVVYDDKVQSTAAVLGFSSPTFGPDIMLPPSINVQLRHVVMKAHGSKRRKVTDTEADDNAEYLAHLLARFSNIPVPQMLAALAYARNPPGIWFFNPSKWVEQHMFKSASVWDIPLVKPRFSCMVDLKLAGRGYDLGLALRQTLTHFQAGTTCETGYKQLDPAHLQPNLNMEFSEATGKPLPSLSDYRISIMYSLSESDGADDASMAVFESSLASVVENFPDAFEVVLVSAGRHRDLFDKAVKKVASYAPYAVRLVTDEASAEPPLPGYPAEVVARRETSRRRLTADEFCLGDHMLHVEPNDVLFRKVTYDIVFRFEKPVVPYGRHPDGEWDHLVECRNSETARIFGEPVDYRFSIFGTNVYPRRMYAQARDFIVRAHASSPSGEGVSFEEIMADTGESWAVPARSGESAETSTCTLEDRESLLPDFAFMDAFMWNMMHDDLYWLPTDPRDLEKEDWATDQFQFYWACRAHYLPGGGGDDSVGGGAADGRGSSSELTKQYIAELESVSSPISCWRFNNRWASN